MLRASTLNDTAIKAIMEKNRHSVVLRCIFCERRIGRIDVDSLKAYMKEHNGLVMCDEHRYTYGKSNL